MNTVSYFHSDSSSLSGPRKTTQSKMVAYYRKSLPNALIVSLIFPAGVFSSSSKFFVYGAPSNSLEGEVRIAAPVRIKMFQDQDLLSKAICICLTSRLMHWCLHWFWRETLGGRPRRGRGVEPADAREFSKMWKNAYGNGKHALFYHILKS